MKLDKTRDMSRRVLCEGQEDIYLASAIFNVLSVEPTPYATQSGGIEKLYLDIDVLLKASGIKKLGIMLDGDTHVEGRWQRVRDVLRQCDETASIPDNYDYSAVHSVNGVMVSVLIMSTVAGLGYSESLLLECIETPNADLSALNEFMSSFPQIVNEHVLFDKRLLQCYLRLFVNSDGNYRAAIPNPIKLELGNGPMVKRWFSLLCA